MMNAPSRRRKIAFWLLMGVFSVAFVEVPCGSTLFPFSGVWAVLVVLPLYTLHSVFFAGLVFRFGKPSFWALYAAGTIYGMYEAYITKVDWVSFRPEGPFARVGGIAIFETILLGFFLHPLLAFVAPLLVTEELATSSSEVGNGLPRRFGNSLRRHPRAWLTGLMVMFGLMQFINSPSPLTSFLSASTTCAGVGLALYLWRRSGGQQWELRELLPQGRGLIKIAALLAIFYIFWGCAIKLPDLPPVWPGQVFIWAIYIGLIWTLRRALQRMNTSPATLPETGSARTFSFSWKAFLALSVVVTLVTTAARALLMPLVAFQVLGFFTFYIVTGLLLLAALIAHGFARPEQLGRQHP
jgi:hypothetical protein